VNGRKLSHTDIDLGTLQIGNSKVYTLDATDGNYYEVLNTNSKIDVKLEEEVQAGKVASALGQTFQTVRIQKRGSHRANHPSIDWLANQNPVKNNFKFACGFLPWFGSECLRKYEPVWATD